MIREVQGRTEGGKLFVVLASHPPFPLSSIHTLLVKAKGPFPCLSTFS